MTGEGDWPKCPQRAYVNALELELDCTLPRGHPQEHRTTTGITWGVEYRPYVD